jgi:L-ribulose-5-phosphate 4-epimerase
MLLELKEKVWKANLDLVKYNLVTSTFGNVSGMDRDQGLVIIKPSGMAYEELMPDDMVVVDMEGNTVDGWLNPSSDTPSHLENTPRCSLRPTRKSLAWGQPMLTTSTVPSRSPG